MNKKYFSALLISLLLLAVESDALTTQATQGSAPNVIQSQTLPQGQMPSGQVPQGQPVLGQPSQMPSQGNAPAGTNGQPTQIANPAYNYYPQAAPGAASPLPTAGSF